MQLLRIIFLCLDPYHVDMIHKNIQDTFALISIIIELIYISVLAWFSFTINMNVITSKNGNDYFMRTI